MQKLGKTKNILLVIMAFMLYITASMPIFAAEKGGSERIIRVGYYPEAGMMDGASEGALKSGYAYDYLQELASIAGWKYEYVYGSFYELYQQILNGDIDMLPYITWTEERTHEILFPDIKMGEEQFYLASINPGKLSDSLEELQGKRVGTTKDAFQNIPFNQLIKEKGIECELVEYINPEYRWEALQKGDVDYSIETSTIYQKINLHAVYEFGERYPYYLVVAPGDEDILAELNTAHALLNEINPGFLDSLKLTYFKSIPLFKELPEEGRIWIENHASIRIGTFDNDEPYVIENEDGTMSGIAVDQVQQMMDELGITLPVYWKLYPGKNEAIEALKSGEIDCINPYYHSYSDAEADGLVISQTLYETDFSVLYLGQYSDDTLSVIATPVTRLGASYVRDNYPEAVIVPCQDGYDCIEKLYSGQANCIVMYTEALQNIATSMHKRYRIKSLQTDCDVCFAALPKDSGLIGILNKAIPFVTKVEMGAIQNRYSIENQSVSIVEFIRSNPEYIYVFIIAVISVILVLILLKRRKDRKHGAELSKLLDETQKAYSIIADQSAFARFFQRPYASAYYVDIEDFTWQIYKCSEAMAKKYPPDENYIDSMNRYISTEICPDDRDKALVLVQPEKMRETLKVQPDITFSFRKISGNGERIMQCSIIRGSDENHVALGFKDITDEVLRQNELAEKNKQSELFLNFIESFTSNYDAVIHGNFVEDTFSVLVTREEFNGLFLNTKTLSEEFQRFLDIMVYSLDREKIAAEMVDFSDIGNRLKVGESHDLEYRCNVSNGYSWYRAKITRINEAEVLIGYCDCNAEIIDRIIDEKLIDEYDAIYYADLDRNEIIASKKSELNQLTLNNIKTEYRSFILSLSEQAAPQYRQDWINYSNTGFMKEYMAEDDHREYVYEIMENEKSMRRFTVDVIERKNGAASTVLLSFMGIDDFRAQSIILHRKMADQKALLDYFVDSYDSAYSVNLIDGTFTIIHMEHAFAELFGENGNTWDSMKMFIEKHIHPDDQAFMLQMCDSKYIIERLRNESSFTFVVREIYNDSIKIMRGVIIRGADESNVAVGFMDITEDMSRQKEEREKLENALLMAQSANKAKTTFLNNMSHDIRTPMNAIIGFTGLAASHIDNREQVMDYLSKIKQSSNHLLSLINDVLDMSRIESGKMTLDEKPEKLSDIITTLINIVQNDINSKHHEFILEKNNITDDNIICDRLRLNQVLLNILSNSIKYTADGGHILMSITQKKHSDGDYATFEFCISDNGMGMDEEYLKTIYDPFTRVKSSTMSGIQGTGLGMAITKNIIDMMGGRIDVKSEPEKGTTMTVILDFRLDRIAGDVSNSEQGRSEVSEFDYSGKKILLVDDNPLNREIATEVLCDDGFIVDVAEDGDIAVAKIRDAAAGEYDLILMDVQMPKVDGYEATRQIRALGTELSKIPIIAMTANAFDEDRKAAMEAGMNEHIAKPIDVNKLHETLNSFLK